MSGVSDDPDESLALMRKWLQEHPDAPYGDARWLAVAEKEMFLMSRASDTAKRTAHEREAQRLLKRLSGSKSAAVRNKAAEWLRDLDE